MLIKAAVPNIDRAILRRYDKTLIEFADGRTRSPEQNRKCHALIGEIAEWAGYLPNEMKRLMKIEFKTQHLATLEQKIFSMHDANMTVVREFISFLVDFIIENGVPTRIPLYEQAEDIGRYVYACAKNRRCAVCGRKADIHHLSGSRLGHGGTHWREKDQDGVMFIPLCREHHMSAHQGEDAFLERFHLQGIEMTRELQKLYGVKKRKED